MWDMIFMRGCVNSFTIVSRGIVGDTFDNISLFAGVIRCLILVSTFINFYCLVFGC